MQDILHNERKARENRVKEKPDPVAHLIQLVTGIIHHAKGKSRAQRKN